MLDAKKHFSEEQIIGASSPHALAAKHAAKPKS
jgi:hypothetical protein